MRLKTAFALALLILVPGSQAAINPDLPFTTETGYTDSLDSVEALVSGSVELLANGASNGTLWLGVDTFDVTGITRLYWQDDDDKLRQASGPDLSIRVATDSSLAFRHPATYDLSYQAEHALGFFVDAGAVFGADSSEDVGFGPSMVAIPVDGATTISRMDPLPETAIGPQTKFNDFVEDSALFLTFSDSSSLVLRDDGAIIETLTGSGRWVAFQGAPQVTPVSATLVAIPTPIGTTVTFAPASAEAAAEGLTIEHVQAAMDSLQSSEGQSTDSQIDGVEQALDAIGPILNGAFIGLEGLNGNSTAEIVNGLTMARFETMSAERRGDSLHWDGSASLQIQNGEVAGAGNLILIFPPWTLVLWAIAIGAFVARLVIKPDQKTDMWDKLSWVGVVGGIVASLIVFILWDRETRALWGTSILSGDASGAGLGFVAAIQLVPLLLAALVIGWPTRSLIKSGASFAGQGKMMRIGAVIAPFAVFLLGAPLMLAYLALILEQL